MFLIVFVGFGGVGASGQGRGGPGGGPGGPGGGPGALEVVDLEVARSRTSTRIGYYFLNGLCKDFSDFLKIS